MKRFAILCFARTGSYRLVDLLNRQTRTVCHGEVFKKEYVELPGDYLKALGMRKEDVQARDARPIMFLNKLFQLDAETADIAGFKLFPNHNDRIINHCLRSPDCQIVFLARNPFQYYFSLLMARNTGVWVKKGDRRPVEGVVRFDPKDFINAVTHQFSFYVRVKLVTMSIGKQTIFVDYSETLSDKTIERIFSGIGGVGYTAVATDHQKILTKPYQDVVENWDEVEGFMRHMGVDHTMTFYEFYDRVMGTSGRPGATKNA